MDIFESIANVSLFKPKGVTIDYLAEVDESVSEIDKQRPLTAEITHKLQEEILFDRVHASAVIEGNSLSRRETIVVLSSGILEAGSRKDQQEVINLADACLYLQDCLENKLPLSVKLIKELHQKKIQIGNLHTELMNYENKLCMTQKYIDIDKYLDDIL